jgi:hypothetical protein
MRETYVRPPLFASEPPSRRLATWRYRVVMIVLTLALIVLVVLMFMKFSGAMATPGFGDALSPLRSPAAP